jgi:hypothetical protein
MMILMRTSLLTLVLIVVAAMLPIANADESNKALPSFRIIERTTEPLLKADRPWEDYCVGYCQVIRRSDTWHMWYASFDHEYKGDVDGMLCYARSADGVNWEKPNLGLVEYGGNTDNNILVRRGMHGHSVFVDEEAPAKERFKMVFVDLVGNDWRIFGATSADGLKWKRIEKPILAKNSDTQTVCFKDGDVYRLYVRMWSEGVYAGKRLVGYSESKTFGDFSDPVVILAPDEKDPADLQFYNPGTAKVRDGLQVMFPSAFYTSNDTVRPHLAVSNDGRTFERIGREPFVELGKGFDSKAIYIGPGAVQSDVADEYWFYYVGSDVGHDASGPDKAKYSGGIGRLRVEVK